MVPLLFLALLTSSSALRLQLGLDESQSESDVLKCHQDCLSKMCGKSLNPVSYMCAVFHTFAQSCVVEAFECDKELGKMGKKIEKIQKERKEEVATESVDDELARLEKELEDLQKASKQAVKGEVGKTPEKSAKAAVQSATKSADKGLADLEKGLKDLQKEGKQAVKDETKKLPKGPVRAAVQDTTKSTHEELAKLKRDIKTTEKDGTKLGEALTKGVIRVAEACTGKGKGGKGNGNGCGKAVQEAPKPLTDEMRKKCHQDKTYKKLLRAIDTDRTRKNQLKNLQKLGGSCEQNRETFLEALKNAAKEAKQQPNLQNMADAVSGEKKGAAGFDDDAVMRIEAAGNAAAARACAVTKATSHLPECRDVDKDSNPLSKWLQGKTVACTLECKGIKKILDFRRRWLEMCKTEKEIFDLDENLKTREDNLENHCKWLQQKAPRLHEG